MRCAVCPEVVVVVGTSLDLNLYWCELSSQEQGGYLASSSPLAISWSYLALDHWWLFGSYLEDGSILSQRLGEV